MYLMNGAILAILFSIAIIAVLVKRSKYAKEANGSIRAEIQLPTGWSEYHTVPCNPDAKSVDVKDFTYMLNPARRRYGKHPMNPFMGLSWLQVPIRIESWYLDNPEPIKVPEDKIVATSAEIKAMTREIQATTAAMEIQEIEARQKELTNAILNQPNKTVVYVLLAAVSLVSIITLIVLAQLAGVGIGL